MKEVELYELFPQMWEDLGKDTVIIPDMIRWCRNYEEKNPDSYINRSRNDILHAHNSNFIWLETKHEGSDIVHKQESLYCPCCGDKMYKFPNTRHFEAVTEMGKVMSKNVFPPKTGKYEKQGFMPVAYRAMKSWMKQEKEQ